MYVGRTSWVVRIVISVVSSAFFLLLSSCNQLSLEDISNDPNYAGVIGNTYKTKKDLLIIGVTADPDYKKVLSYAVIVQNPGFSGPEVVSKDKLNKNTIIKILKVFKTSSLFISRVFYIVEIVGSEKYKNIEIRIKISGETDDSNHWLSAAVFEKTGQEGG